MVDLAEEYPLGRRFRVVRECRFTPTGDHIYPAGTILTCAGPHIHYGIMSVYFNDAEGNSIGDYCELADDLLEVAGGHDRGGLKCVVYRPRPGILEPLLD